MSVFLFYKVFYSEHNFIFVFCIVEISNSSDNTQKTYLSLPCYHNSRIFSHTHHTNAHLQE